MSAELLLGDCLELMSAIPDGSVDMVLCDLPYGMTQNKWDIPLPFDRLWEQWHRVCKPTAAIVLHCMQPFTSMLIGSNTREFKYAWVWDKHYCRNFLNATRQPMRNHEDIAVFYRKQCTYNPQMVKGKLRLKGSSDKQSGNYNAYTPTRKRNDVYYPKTIISIPGVPTGKLTHPTEKPVELAQYLIRTYTNQGETVLDNCMGTGCTGVAATLTGRNFIGIEQDEKYFDIAKERINNAGSNH